MRSFEMLSGRERRRCSIEQKQAIVAAADVVGVSSQPLDAMRLLATVPGAVWAWAAGSWHGIVADQDM
jgi:hypothetical protein